MFMTKNATDTMQNPIRCRPMRDFSYKTVVISGPPPQAHRRPVGGDLLQIRQQLSALTRLHPHVQLRRISERLHGESGYGESVVCQFPIGCKGVKADNCWRICSIYPCCSMQDLWDSMAILSGETGVKKSIGYSSCVPLIVCGKSLIERQGMWDSE